MVCAGRRLPIGVGRSDGVIDDFGHDHTIASTCGKQFAGPTGPGDWAGPGKRGAF